MKSPVAVKGAAREQVVHRSVPTVAEVEALSKAVPECFEGMVLLAAWRAMRFGELAALRRDRIDLLHREVIVTETVAELATGERLLGQPKTAAGRRSVAIPPNVLPEVERHLSTIGPAAGALVFPGADGGFLRRGHFYHQVWTPAVRATGLRFRFHDPAIWRLWPNSGSGNRTLCRCKVPLRCPLGPLLQIVDGPTWTGTVEVERRSRDIAAPATPGEHLR
jgi:integrase